MNWRQLLNKLDNRTLKWFNRKVTEEAQKCYLDFPFRCFNCEKYLICEAEHWMGAQTVREIANWDVVEDYSLPGVIQLYYFCPTCKESPSDV